MQLTILTLLIALLTGQNINAQCPVPNGLSAISNGATSANLSWQSVSGVTSYLINVENGRNNPSTFLVSGTTVNPVFVVNGLTGGFVYKFKVRSNCGGNHSSWSAWYTFVAGGGAINCNLLTGLSVSNITSTSSTFSWNPSPGGFGYRLKVEDGFGNPVNFSFAVNTISSSYTITGLSPSSNYKVKIRKLCAVGVTGPWSAWIPFTTAALRLSGSSEAESVDISMLPNPASTYFHLDVGNSEEKIKSVEIFDLTGRVVLSILVDSQVSFTLSTQNFKNGIYVVKIQTNNSFTSKRLVVAN